MNDACLWCGVNVGLVASHALKKRSLGGKETIDLCATCDLWFDEHKATLKREGDFLVGYGRDGQRLGMVPLEPRPLPAVIQAVKGVDSLNVLQETALRLDDDSLYGLIASMSETSTQLGWAKRVLCYAIKVRHGWRSGWAKVAASRIDSLAGVRLEKSQIYQYALDWELLMTEFSDQLEALTQLNPTIMSLIWRAEDTSHELDRKEARREAVNVALENPGKSIRDTAAELQDHNLLPKSGSLWACVRRAAFAGDRAALDALQAQWLESEWDAPELLALYGDIGCFLMWAAGRKAGEEK